MPDIKINTEELAKVDYKPKEKPKTFVVLGEDNPLLKQVMPDFDFSEPPVNANEFASTLVETCKEHNGLGLAANQCGYSYRVFVMGSGDNYVAFFNPKIISQSIETSHMIEGCLSYPLLGLMITRPTTINVEYQDFNGEVKKAIYDGLTARVFLHEFDHLNGIEYTKRAKPLALKSGMDKRAKAVKKITKQITNIGTTKQKAKYQKPIRINTEKLKFHTESKI